MLRGWVLGGVYGNLAVQSFVSQSVEAVLCTATIAAK